MIPAGIFVLIRYQAQPGKAAQARSELTALTATVVAAEQHCLGIRVHQDLNDETLFLLYEQWTDLTAYLGPHMQTAHLQAFIGRAAAFLSGPPQITFLSSVADNQRESEA